MTPSPAAPDDPSLRMFFAAVPGVALRERIDAAARSLQLGSTAHWVPPTNYHMTLAFVGAVSASRLTELQSIGRAQRAARFVLRFDAYDYWPKPAMVVAVAREVPSALQRLWSQIHRDLAERGWALEAKRLRPHVTLARKVPQDPVLQAMSPVEWPVEEISLMHSDTSGAASVYTVVDTWSLLYEAEKQ
jgi:2'-5' RNA ligase